MNSEISPLFIGYTSLESWLNAIDKGRPVFAQLIQFPGKPTEYGHRTDQLVILATQPNQTEGLVHYCRMVVGTVQYVGNDPFTPDHNLRFELAETAWAIVRGWLEQQGLPIRQGILAIPLNLRLTDGWPGFLKFDKEQQTYVRKE